MPTYSELLQSEEWKKKREVILKRDKTSCTHCFNYNHLSDLYVGYIKRLKSTNELLVGWNIPGLRNSSVNDFDTDFRMRMLFISDKDKISFNGTKNYIVYYEIKDKSRTIVAISEVPTSYEYLENISNKLFIKRLNPYRTNEFIKNAKFVQLKGLHIHHTYYQLGKLPWEYPDVSLVTVCWKCHEKIHATQEIPYLDINGLQIGNLTPCNRCKSAGYFPEYRHVENGICFRCRGKRFEELIN